MKRFFCVLLVIFCVFAGTESIFADEPEPGRGHVTINTNVTGISVFVDRFLEIKETKDESFTLENLKPGRHYFVLVKDGYYTEEFYAYVKADLEVAHEIKMRQITGFLNLSIEQKNATIYLDGEQIKAGFYELPIGKYDVSTRLFGYEPYKKTITIRQQDLVTLAINLQPSEFAITSVSANKKEFNPYSQGSLGSVDIKTSVTAPGAGFLTIEDKNGNLVYSYDYGRFQTFDTSASWNGVNQETGMIVPDGVYNVIVCAEGQFMRTSVQVNTSLFYPLTNIGSKGLQFGTLVDPEFVPGGTVYFAFDAVPTFTFDQFCSCPLSLNLTIFASNYFSLGTTVALDFSQNGGEPVVWWSGNAKLGNKLENFYYSLFFSYTSGYSLIARFNQPGFEFGGAFGLSLGRFFVVANAGGRCFANDFDPKVGLACNYQAETCSFGGWVSSNIKDSHLIGASFCQFFGKSQVYLNCDVSVDVLNSSLATKIGITTIF